MSIDAYFDFLTDKKNWDIVVDIHNHLPSVKQKMLDSFWGRVKEHLQSTYPDGEWHIEKSDDLFGKISGLAVWHEEWGGIFKVGYGRLDGHVWVGVFCKDISGETYNKLADQLKNVMPKNKRDSTSWPSWYNPGEDFSDVSSYVRILPAYQEDTAAEYAKRLEELNYNSKKILVQYAQLCA